MVVNFCGDQIFIDFIRNENLYAWCLRYNIYWFIDIRISTCLVYCINLPKHFTNSFIGGFTKVFHQQNFPLYGMLAISG